MTTKPSNPFRFISRAWSWLITPSYSYGVTENPSKPIPTHKKKTQKPRIHRTKTKSDSVVPVPNKAEAEEKNTSITPLSIDESYQKIKNQKEGYLSQLTNLTQLLDWNIIDSKKEIILNHLKKSEPLNSIDEQAITIRVHHILKDLELRKHKYLHDHAGNAAKKSALIKKAEKILKQEQFLRDAALHKNLDHDWLKIGFAGNQDSSLNQTFTHIQSLFETHLNEEQNKLWKIQLEHLENFKNLLTNAKNIWASLPKEHSFKNRKELKSLLKKIESLSINLPSTAFTEKEDFETLKYTIIQAWEEQDNLQQNEKKQRQEQAEKLIAEIENIVLEKSWGKGSKRIPQINQEWRYLRVFNLPNGVNLNNHFEQITAAFFAQKDLHFEEKNKKEALALAAKRSIIHGLQTLRPSLTSRELKEALDSTLQAWKKAGHAGHQESELWDIFKDIRTHIWEEVNRLRSLEKDDFIDRLAGAFARRKEQAAEIEAAIFIEEQQQQEEESFTNPNEHQINKLKQSITKNKEKLTKIQQDMVEIQRKLAKFSKAKNKAS